MDHPCYSRSENFSSRVSNRDLLNRDLAVVIPGFMRKREGEISHTVLSYVLYSHNKPLCHSLKNVVSPMSPSVL